MKKIVYDGECRVCVGFKELSEIQVPGSDLQFIAYQDETFQSSPKRNQLDYKKSLVVITEQGDVYHGARAVFAILKDFPGLPGILGDILFSPPFYWMAEPLYKIFARHRHKIFE